MFLSNLKILSALGLLLLSCISAVEKSFPGMKEGLSSYITNQQVPVDRCDKTCISALEDSKAAKLLEEFSREKYLTPRETHQNGSSQPDRFFYTTLYRPRVHHPLIITFDFSSYLRNLNTSHLIPILRNLRL